MLSPQEIEPFMKTVMACYDNNEFRSNWERLRKRRLNNKQSMGMFIADVKDLVWDRLPAEARSPAGTPSGNGK